MIQGRTLALGAALAVSGSAAFLVSGHELLNWPARGLPLGTLAAGLIAAGLAAFPYALAPAGSRVRPWCLAVLLLGLAWLPACLLLAGNGRLNFSGGARYEAALVLSAVTAVAIVAGLVIAAGARVRRISRSTFASHRRPPKRTVDGQLQPLSLRSTRNGNSVQTIVLRCPVSDEHRVVKLGRLEIRIKRVDVAHIDLRIPHSSGDQKPFESRP